MKFNTATIEWGKGKLSILESLHGYPKADPQITMYARALLRIAHPGAVLARWNHTEITDDVLALTPEQLDAILIESTKVGTVNPMEWLLEMALDQMKFFPAPLELRVIFYRYFPCADGVTPEEEA